MDLAPAPEPVDAAVENRIVRVIFDEDPTDAPVIGEVLDSFEVRLDERNPVWRLSGVCADAGMLGPYWLAATSHTGLSHLHKGTTCQDSYGYAVAADGGAVVAAVTDGLGSRPYSQLGSTLLARLLCQSLAREASSDVVDATERVLHRAVRRVSRQLRRILPRFEDSALASTAVFCWISTDPDHRVGVAGRVGDCAMFTMRGHEYQAVFARDEGPLNVVHSYLPNHDPHAALEIAWLDLSDRKVLFLASDGLGEDVYRSQLVREWLAERWARPPGAVRMINSLRYRRRGSHDDRTALAIWLEPG